MIQKNKQYNITKKSHKVTQSHTKSHKVTQSHINKIYKQYAGAATLANKNISMFECETVSIKEFTEYVNTLLLKQEKYIGEDMLDKEDIINLLFNIYSNDNEEDNKNLKKILSKIINDSEFLSGKLWAGNNNINLKLNNTQQTLLTDDFIELLVSKIYGLKHTDEVNKILTVYLADVTYPQVTKINNFKMYSMSSMKKISKNTVINSINYYKIMFGFIIFSYFIKLRYCIINWLNLDSDVKQLLEKTINKQYGLKRFYTDYKKTRYHDIKYYNISIQDNMSLTLLEACYILKMFAEDDRPTFIHCYASCGRTGYVILLLIVTKLLCKLLKDNKIDEAIEFCIKYLCNTDAYCENLKQLLLKHYTYTYKGREIIVSEIFEDGIITHINLTNILLFCNRMNTLKLAILWYITIKNLWHEKLKDLQLSFFNSKFAADVTCNFTLDDFNTKFKESNKLALFNMYITNYTNTYTPLNLPESLDAVQLKLKT